MTRSTLILGTLALSVGLLTGPVWGEAPSTRPAEAAVNADGTWEMNDFLRHTDAGDGGGSLDTSIITFRRPDGTRVHLVSAVHIGENAYYQNLAADFATCDVVLYEMVKPRDMPVPAPGAHRDSGVAKLQSFLKDVLELDYQLDAIDYRQPNFVHADLDAETFTRLQDERGESMATLMLQQLLQAMRNPQMAAAEQQVNMMDLLTRPDGTRQIKTILAQQFGAIEEEMLGLGGPTSVILTERNKAAMAALEKAVGDGHKEIAVFYGAAHMPDLARQVEAMGFEPVEQEWRMAWDLTIRPGAPSAFEKLMNHLGELQQVQ